jgi:hypothetical protein
MAKKNTVSAHRARQTETERVIHIIRIISPFTLHWPLMDRATRLLSRLQRTAIAITREVREVQAQVHRLERRVQFLEERPGRPLRANDGQADEQLRELWRHAMSKQPNGHRK